MQRSIIELGKEVKQELVEELGELYTMTDLLSEVLKMNLLVRVYYVNTVESIISKSILICKLSNFLI